MRHLLLCCVVLLAACASPQKRLMEDLAEADEARRDLEAERAKVAQKAAKRTLAAYPEWALTAPPPDGAGFYAVGVGQSPRLEMARSKAQLRASYSVAKQLRQEIAGGERLADYDRDGQSSSTYTVLIDQLVDWQPVVGYEVLKQEIVPIDGVFHAYLLVRMPLDGFNRALEERRRAAHDEAVRRDFDELHRRLGALRAAKQAEAATQASPAPGLTGTPD